MGAVLSYDDKFATPSSEIKLDSGEHVFLVLDKNGLAIKSISSAGKDPETIFSARPDTVAKICAGLFDDRGESKATPLQVLTSAVTQLTNAAAVRTSFEAAATAVGADLHVDDGRPISGTLAGFALAPLWVPVAALPFAIREPNASHWITWGIITAIGYAASLLVGLPAFLTLRRSGFTAWWVSASLGFFIGVATVYMFSAFVVDMAMYDMTFEESLTLLVEGFAKEKWLVIWTFVQAGLLGSVIGLTIWLIARPDRHGAKKTAV